MQCENIADLELATSADLLESVCRVHERRLIDNAKVQYIREKTLGRYLHALGFTYMRFTQSRAESHHPPI